MTMKYLLLLLFSFTSLSFGQNFKTDEGRFTKSNKQLYLMDTIVETTNSKAVLYQNSLKWISKKYKNSKINVISKDENLGEINLNIRYYEDVTVNNLIKGDKTKTKNVPVGYETNCKIILKDNKYKIIVSDLYYNYGARGNVNPLDLDMSINKESKLTGIRFNKELLNDISKSLNKKLENDF